MSELEVIADIAVNSRRIAVALEDLARMVKELMVIVREETAKG